MIPGDWVGREIDGRYIVESVLGVGGMGTVLRAKHKFTGVPVAVKVLRSEVQLDPDVQQRFLAEAQAPNRIGHPAIVKVLDAGRMPEGTLYMAMELLVGRSLRVAMTSGQKMRHRDLSPDKIRCILLDLLSVLGAAHAKGFVHRDLKPDNVFLCAPNDEVKLLDFGIAKVLGDAVVRGNTVAGDLLGTPAYMAPEQLADASNVDARADLWAVGVILYELVAGHLPLYGATAAELLGAVAAGRTIPIRTYVPHVSREVEQFFERALAPDPRRRFGAAVELAQAVGSLALPVAPDHAPAVGLGDSATVGAGSTVASVAMQTPMAPSAYAPPPMAPPAFVQPPSAARSNRALRIAVGAAAALGLVIVIAVAAGGSKKPTTTDAVVRPDPPPDRVVVETPRRPDARLDDDDDDVPLRRVDAGAPRSTDGAECRVACAAVLQRCGTTWGNCEQECIAKPAHLQCLRRSLDDCSAGAMCATGVVCKGSVPRGTASCLQVATCEGRCKPYDFDCGCECMAKLDPTLILQIARFNSCIFRCNLQPDCVRASCGAQYAACK